MTTIMLLILIALAVIFTLLSFYWESITFTALSIITWFISVWGCYNYEIPYVYVQGNTITETTQQITTMYPLGWLFMIIGIIMTLWLFNLSFETWKEKQPKVL